MKYLRKDWIEKIFAKLHGIYGTAFTRKYMTGQVNAAGEDAGLENAKQAWAEELAGFHDRPDAIAYALQSLPADFPPDAIKFRDLCRQAPKPTQMPLLDAPKMDPAIAREKLARIAEFLGRKLAQ